MNNEKDKTLLTMAQRIPVYYVTKIGYEANESRLAVDRFVTELRASSVWPYFNGMRGILCRHSGKFRKFK